MKHPCLFLSLLLALCSPLHAQTAQQTNTFGVNIDTDAEANSFLTALARGTSISATELGYLDGVSSNLQTQLNAKQSTITFGTGVQTALGINIGSAGAPILFNGAAGTPSSLTLTNASGLPASGLVPSTSQAVGFGTIELGHASDTTLSRSAAGKLAVEGDIVSTLAADETHSGDRNLTGSVTIANQDTSVATSAMNVGMAKDLSFYEIGSVYRPAFAGFNLQASGTGASAAASYSRVRLYPGTATGGHARAEITGQPHSVAYNIRFDRPAGVSLRLDINKTDATDTLNAFRLLWGDDGTYPAGDANAFTGKGMGLEIRSDGTNHRMRAISHDGSTYTTGSWVNFDTGDASDFSRMVSIETDGAGNITATISSQAGNRPFYTSTISGGVTGTGSGAASTVTALVVNDSTGTPTPFIYQITDCVIKSY